VMGLFPILIIYRIISNFKIQMSNQIQSSNVKGVEKKSFGFGMWYGVWKFYAT